VPILLTAEQPDDPSTRLRNQCLDGRQTGSNPETRLGEINRDLPEAKLRASVEVCNQVSHPLRLDSGRGSSGNRHLSPSVNTSRLMRT